MIRKMLGKMKRYLSTRRTIALGGSTQSVVSYTTQLIQELTDWTNKTDWEIYEQLYRIEPEIGGAIDRMASLIAQSYQGVYVRAGKTLDDDEQRLLRLATAVEQSLGIRRWFEIIAELLLIHGNAYLYVKQNSSKLPALTILPNDRVTIVDSRSRIGSTSDDVIMEANYYVLNEGSNTDTQKVYTKSDIYHFKYKDTPIYITDRLGRLTYGIYSPSPLDRALLPTLWKREVMLIDVVWRWKNVPREHHKINSSLFDLNRYTGSLDERRQKAEQDAETTINKYVQTISEKQPDQAYVTTDTIDINVLNPGGGKYMSPNELMDQLSRYLWIAMGVPESIVSGRAGGSYASELVVSSYVTAKAIQLAEKIRDGLLTIVRDAVKRIDPKLPVEKLDMKLELILETNRMELFRQAAIMADMKIFTPTEIRQHLGYPELTQEQLNELLIWSDTKSNVGRHPGDKNVSDIVADELRTTRPIQYPATPHVQEDRRGGG